MNDVNGKFIEYASMFKLQSRPCVGGHNESPRQLECVACGNELSWAIYTVEPSHFDVRCSMCGVWAKDFYKNKLHRELEGA
jgi:hypothetical protein